MAGPKPGWTETGVASWYGYPYHGRRAANGEIYDMNQLTAAHRTLPFGAVVKVTSLTNGKSVTVRITDRGPFIDGRIIDLSRQAAREIDMIGPGIMKVHLQILGYGPAYETPAAQARGREPGRVEVPRPTEPPTAVSPDQGPFAVQVGLFNDKDNAERLKRKLEAAYHPVDLIPREGERTQWRVVVGNRPSEETARALAAELRRAVGEAMVVRRDLP